MQDILGRIAADRSLKKLHQYLEIAGLADTLKGAGPFTLFAPNDAAFARTNVEERLDGTEGLRSTLRYHLVHGRYGGGELSALKATALRTENGKSLTLVEDEGEVMVDNARLVQRDIECSNGLVHVIDNVFLPQLSGWYGDEYG
jgi:uncharacterized surface protein with fasciclin (FAS1) repeats